jgi:Holliday junction DNA helicase RuvA
LEKGRLYTYFQVKEDAHVLFGFSELSEKEMFQLLISVSGVGSATARMMLSSLRADEVRTAILVGNLKLIESIKGIGKKTAERLVLELKDKVGKNAGGADLVLSAHNSLAQDALNALIALGISKSQAEAAVQKIIRAEPTLTILEDLIKKSLKAI